MGNGDSDGDGQWQWQLQLPMVTETAMANGKGNGEGDGWWQRTGDGGGDGQWWLQQQWQMVTATAIGYGDVDSNSNRDINGDSNGNCNGNGHGDGVNDKGRVASSCAGNVQYSGRGNTLPPLPWTQRKVHSPVLRHGGDTAESVCSLWRGMVSDSSPWIVFLFVFYNYCSVYWTTLCLPPALFRRSKTLLAHWCSTSSTPPRTLSAYWQSSLAPIALFVKLSPGRACNDYNLSFLCWCEMTYLSATFFISQTFPLSLTEHTKFIWKHPVVIVETFKVKFYLTVSRHYPAQPFRPVLVLAFAWQLFSTLHLCLAPFPGSLIILQLHNWSLKFWKSTVLDSAKLFGQICFFCFYLALSILSLRVCLKERVVAL